MRNRILLITTILAIFLMTGVLYAADGDLIVDGNFTLGGTVNGNYISSTPAPNTIPVSGSDGKLSPAWFQGGSLLNVQYLTTAGSGVYTPTSGTNKIIVELVGGGGGGEPVGPITSVQLAMGQSGGSGGYARKTFTGISGTYTYTIGAGGCYYGCSVPNGGNTSFTGPGSVTVTAYGGSAANTGSGGTSLIILNGAPGGSISTNGDINVAGNPGGLSVAQNAGGATGPGGASVFGGPGAGVSVTAYQTTPGNDATGYGSGGSGAIGYGSGPLVYGGSGKQGIIIVSEFN